MIFEHSPGRAPVLCCRGPGGRCSVLEPTTSLHPCCSTSHQPTSGSPALRGASRISGPAAPPCVALTQHPRPTASDAHSARTRPHAVSPAAAASEVAELSLLLRDWTTVAVLLWAGLGPGALSTYLQAKGQARVQAAQAQVGRTWRREGREQRCGRGCVGRTPHCTVYACITHHSLPPNCHAAGSCRHIPA